MNGLALLTMCGLLALPIVLGCGDDSGDQPGGTGATGAAAGGNSNSGSGGSSGGASGGSPGMGGSSGGISTGGAATAGSGGSFATVVDIDDESFFGEDDATIRGVVQLPEALAMNAGLQVGLASSVPSTAWVGNEIYGGRKKQAGTMFAFVIRNLDAGSYTIFARADANGSTMFDSGDLGGYNGGSVEASVLEPASSTAVTVGAGQTVDVEFGLGTIR